MRDLSRTQDVVRHVCRGLLVLAWLSASFACAGRPPPPNGSIQAVELTPEARLGIDDVFEVRVLGEQDLSGAYRIAADGTIDYPFIGRVAVIAVFAAFIAWQTIVSLTGTFVTGIAGTAQDAETKAKQWNYCTQWSFPKVESLGLFVPGLFGYKMDTPHYMEFFQDAYRGGQYWGAIGRDAAWEQYFANGNKGPAPDPGRFIRQTGGGGYAGILVALLAAWAVAQSFRRQNSVFADNQRRMVWFWFALLVISLLLSF